MINKPIKISNISLLKYQLLIGLIFLIAMELISRGYYQVIINLPFLGPSNPKIDFIHDYHHPYLPVVFNKNTQTSREGGIRINNVGFRGPDVSFPKTPGSLRIVALGGSTTWGMGLRDEETWPRLIEKNLRNRFPSKTIEVINAGVSGYNSMEDLINLITKILPLEPDILLEYQGFNDMKVIAAGANFQPDYSGWRIRQNPHENWRETAVDSSRFLFLLDNLFAKVIKKPIVSDFRSQILFHDYGQLASFKRNLFNIVAISRANNIVPVLATFNLALDSSFVERTNWVNVKSSEYRPMLAAYNQQIRDLATEKQVEWIDAEKYLPDDGSDYFDICHLNVKGSNELAGLISSKIEEIIAKKPSFL